MEVGVVAVAAAWFVQGNFAPVSYAFDNYLPWLFAGIALGLPAQAQDGLRPSAANDGPSVGRTTPTTPSPTYA